MSSYSQLTSACALPIVTLEAAEEVAVFGILAADVDEEVAVEAEVVTVAVGVGGGLADPLTVLLVGEGLEGGDRAIELSGGEAAAELRLVGASVRGPCDGAGDVEAGGGREAVPEGLLEAGAELAVHVIAGRRGGEGQGQGMAFQ